MYCSQLSSEQQEPLAGTAPFAEHFFFITWPKTCWGDKALVNSKGGFPPHFREWLDENSEKYGKILTRLISSPEVTSSATVTIYAYPAQVQYVDVPREEIYAVLEAHLQGRMSEAYGKPIESPRQFFVCTHGRHDKCCAKFGQRVFQALSASAQQAHIPAEIWEATHLGGHRFAATLLEFPSGHMYGRVTPEQAPSLLAGEVPPELYRGCSFRPPWLQAVETHIRQHCRTHQLRGDVQIADDPAPVEGRVEVAFRVGAQDFSAWKLILRQQEFVGPTSCEDLSLEQPRKLWVRESLQPLAFHD
jgi:hypothetical protein